MTLLAGSLGLYGGHVEAAWLDWWATPDQQGQRAFDRQDYEQAAEHFWNDARNRYEDRRYDPERPLLPPADIFLPVEDCFARLKHWPRVVVSQEDVEVGVGRERFDARSLPDLAIQAKASEPLAALRRFIEEYPGRVLFCAESAGRREVLLELLALAGVPWLVEVGVDRTDCMCFPSEWRPRQVVPGRKCRVFRVPPLSGRDSISGVRAAF